MASEQQKSLNCFADGFNNEMMDEKCDLYESSRTDSGFISSSNILVSEEIKSEDIHPAECSLVLNDRRKTENADCPVSMRLDSGVDLALSDSFSNLSLKNPNLNDLNSGKIKDSIKSVQLREEHPPWELYFEQDEDGDTQLHIAIVQEFPELVKALIRAAPHPRLLDTPNDDAQTPLHLAVMTQQYQIIRWLIVAGAQPCPRNLQGDSPLHLCARVGDVQSCRAITEPVTKYERDSLALSYSPQPFKRCDYEQWNYEGQTCVHVAAIYGHTDILRHLIKCGADVNAREGTGGYTVLHYALQRGDEKMAHFLLSQSMVNPAVLTYGRKNVLQISLHIPSTLIDILHTRGVDSYLSSDEEFDDSEDEVIYDNVYRSSVIQASA